MSQDLIDNQNDFETLCDAVREAGVVAFDTEFVSEHTYLPELCLLQFATRDRVAAVDPFAVKDLSKWWEIMADDATTILVHGGQAEVKFCLSACERPPRKLYDIQIAEAFRSRSYPLSYVNILQRVLNRKISGKETRTDWRRRPLLPRQIQYALEDVRYIIPVWEDQCRRLRQLGRMHWAEAEFERLVEENTEDRNRAGWLRLSGLHRLNRRELAVARELCQWREQEARSRNKPLRVILRDDLLLELARRQPTNRTEILATRDMERDRYRRHLDELVSVIRRAKEIPEDQLPARIRTDRQDNSQDDHVIGKLLALALANRCSELEIAQSILATSADLRELVRWSLSGRDPKSLPKLMVGWRSEVCGQLLTDVMDGKISIRVAHPESDHPLVFEQREVAVPESGESRSGR